jgi:gamma-glutamyltranspeptidase/glutathione hydrolase
MLLLFLIYHLIFDIIVAQDVTATQGMVASAHPLASQVGIEVLQRGGNAVDAAVATAFALAVVEPNASGLGGGGFMLIKLSDKSPICIDYREMAPSAAVATFYYHSEDSFDSLSRRGAHSIGVPGVPAGLSLAVEKYGTFPLSELIVPAIKLAHEGFPISEKQVDIIFQNYGLIQANKASADIFLADDLPPSAGHILQNPNLANSIELLGIHGPKIFYQGKLAESLSQTIQQEDGFLTVSDFAKYHVKLKHPVYGKYRGYEIITSAPPASGACLLEMLNILENFNLNHYQHNSPKYLHLLAESMKMVFRDRAENLADPDFYTVPVGKLTGKDHAQKLAAQIDSTQASYNYQAPRWVKRESNNTTHLSVIDSDQNTVALTQSINSWFGSGIMDPETGILLNNHMADFSDISGHPNSIEPFKRPVSSMAPTIILKEGKPVLTIGTPGGTRIISALTQIIINIIDFEMSIDEAIEAPRIHAQDSLLHLEKRIDETIQIELRQFGHYLKVHDGFDPYFGGAQGILRQEDDGILLGGADSRRDGYVEGY